MMTPDEIKASIDIEGIKVREGDTTEFYWITLTTTIDDRQTSHSVRVSKTPSPDELASAQKALELWWAEVQA